MKFNFWKVWEAWVPPSLYVIPTLVRPPPLMCFTTTIVMLHPIVLYLPVGWLKEREREREREREEFVNLQHHFLFILYFFFPILFLEFFFLKCRLFLVQHKKSVDFRFYLGPGKREFWRFCLIKKLWYIIAFVGYFLLF